MISKEERAINNLWNSLEDTSFNLTYSQEDMQRDLRTLLNEYNYLNVMNNRKKKHIEKLENEIKELGKGQQSLIHSRRKWKHRYYKMKRKNKELQKAVEQIYDDYQDIGKIAFDYKDRIEELETKLKKYELETLPRMQGELSTLKGKAVQLYKIIDELEAEKQKLIKTLEKANKEDTEKVKYHERA